MRRSKSDPAKYTKNYRKISQRRMTQFDNFNEEKEIRRLKEVLKNSEEKLQHVVEPQTLKGKKRKRVENASDHNPINDILAPELLEEQGMLGEETDLVLMPSKKSKKKTKPRIVLTPEEIKKAKADHKNAARKLKQLEARAEQKKERAEIYKKLEANKLTDEAMGLLSSSGKLSRKNKSTKRETLKMLLKKERAGIVLSEAEKDMLYTTNEVDNVGPDAPKNLDTTMPQTNQQVNQMRIPEGSKKKEDTGVNNVESQSRKQKDESLDGAASSQDSERPQKSSVSEPQAVSDTTSFAAKMMASLSKLKTATERKDVATVGSGTQGLNEMAVSEGKKYTPKPSTVLKTAASLGISPLQSDSKSQVLRVKRPLDVAESRYDLPVSAAEFEVIDAIRNNDVTIICSETGSGKSTQVPIFLYESGFTLSSDNSDRHFLIGITQPRRVAAVSTAKRVCYETGCGDGQSIKSRSNKGNLVAYRTRYETAGTGPANRILFMTDGVLLQEIQTDLLLRKYSVIVLDESHERNLNTDVLIGLLSMTIPMRKKAFEEDKSLPPLKLVLMSATLRVEDFTENERLFAFCKPAVVRVPGRTHPVTIHHSKVTELDDYETAAFRKIVKIHKKLPAGAILVFLTGRQEIVRMVRRLRRSLCREKCNKEPVDSIGTQDVAGVPDEDIPREMDDDEVDAELELGDRDDFEDIDADDDEVGPAPIPSGENIPQKAVVLPLYSMLSSEEQARVFSPIPAGHRLIVLATNIAETSITIPGVSYVVDTGRQKCRNYHAGTGIASYDIMWISKAAADQRAGRAGRTGPGHCYRLYSSSLYTRHMDEFALPEILTRPLEDVVLSMKSMRVANVASFPFPTSPDANQIDAAVQLLAALGCLDVSNTERDGSDGSITKLGLAVCRLPLGVRYAKMLLVAANAGALDYAIVLVAILSEMNPILYSHTEDPKESTKDAGDIDDDRDLDDVDKTRVKEEALKMTKKRTKWYHRQGDLLAGMLAVGAFTYAGRGAGGAAEQAACKKFCEENHLNFALMARVQKMRSHLARLAKSRLGKAGGVAAKSGGFLSSMKPPNKLQETILVQAIASGLLDHIAMLAPPGAFSVDGFSLRTAYMGVSASGREPLLMDPNSVLFSRDPRQLPKWICFDSLQRKTRKDGSTVTVMKNITPIDPSWLAQLAQGSRLLNIGKPLDSPPVSYDKARDEIQCPVETKFGNNGWDIPPLRMNMSEALQSNQAKHSSRFMIDDSFRWFARFLLEGKVIDELKGLDKMLNESPATLTRHTPMAKVAMLVSQLKEHQIDSASDLRRHWAEHDDKFLFRQLKNWTKVDQRDNAKSLWVNAVKESVKKWKMRDQSVPASA